MNDQQLLNELWNTDLRDLVNDILEQEFDNYCQLPKAKAYRLARLDLTIGQLTLACPIGSNCKNLNEKGS